jgi:hypothetical protein
VESEDIVLNGHIVEKNCEDSLLHLAYGEVSFVHGEVVKFRKQIE